MATSAPRARGVARRRDLPPSSSTPAISVSLSCSDVRARLGDADLLHQLDARDARVDARDRRRAGLEAAGVGAGE